MRNEDHAHVWTEWHRAASQRDGAALLALYADDAVLESPLVTVVFPDRDDGVLRGRAQIAAFLRDGARRLAIPDVRWWRDETWFSSGDTLVWEYPRETPDGEQIDILEVMRVRARLIVSHRIYWGWKGCALAGRREREAIRSGLVTNNARPGHVTRGRMRARPRSPACWQTRLAPPA